ncbi:uncharacterized protein A4U43_C05F28600 [Asparagus officinalis]|uniref:Uncharacterized protein n=1 Tax=Asparagus officinalis TaxID=4686 RepID=A0A5P1EV55_ASPOF|nr:uncharacterized protein A4U43_C05F28600 [Asparagus officinalis]
MVYIHVPGFQTIAIFMQTGAPKKTLPTVKAISEVVKDLPHKGIVGFLTSAALFVELGEEVAYSLLLFIRGGRGDGDGDWRGVFIVDVAENGGDALHHRRANE